MKTTRALYITNLGLLDNLARTQILPYLEGLAKNGLDIEILSFEKKENLSDASTLIQMAGRLKKAGIGWSYLRYHRRWGNIWDVVAGAAKCFRIIRKKKISVLHARASIPIIIAWPLAKLLGLKVIYDRRGTMVGDFVDDVNIKNIFSLNSFARVLDAFDHFIIRHSDATVVLSEKALELLKNDPRLSRKKAVIESIPCCVDPSRFPGVKNTHADVLGLDSRFTICYLGSLGTCYLLKEMAVFFKTLKEKRADALFLVISHTDKGYISGVLDKEGLRAVADYIVIGVKPDEVGQYLSRTKFGIMFIKPVECKIGSSPTKFAESLASGIPVIINKGIGDTEDIIRDRKIGVLVEGLDVSAYKKAVRAMFDLMETEGLKARCVETARRYFSLDLGVERYVNVYKKIMG